MPRRKLSPADAPSHSARRVPSEARPRHAAIAFAIVIAATAVAAALVASNARADDITVDATAFVGTLTREEVSPQLKVPFSGGNPWSGSHNMFQARSAVTSDQVTREYESSRDEVNALTGEDSGSAYFMKTALLPAGNAAAVGGPAR